jgi:hypothetical protein
MLSSQAPWCVRLCLCTPVCSYQSIPFGQHMSLYALHTPLNQHMIIVLHGCKLAPARDDMLLLSYHRSRCLLS